MGKRRRNLAKKTSVSLERTGEERKSLRQRGKKRPKQTRGKKRPGAGLPSATRKTPVTVQLENIVKAAKKSQMPKTARYDIVESPRGTKKE